MIPLEKWVELFTLDLPPILVGINPDRFPLDMTYTYDFVPQLKKFSRTHQDHVRTRLDADDLINVAQRLGLEVTEIS